MNEGQSIMREWMGTWYYEGVNGRQGIMREWMRDKVLWGSEWVIMYFEGVNEGQGNIMAGKTELPSIHFQRPLPSLQHTSPLHSLYTLYQHLLFQFLFTFIFVTCLSIFSSSLYLSSLLILFRYAFLRNFLFLFSCFCFYIS